MGEERPSSAPWRANRGRSGSPTGTRCKKDGFRTGSPPLVPFLLFPGLLLPTCNVWRFLLDSSPVVHPAAASRSARLPHQPLAHLHLMCSLSPAPLPVPVGKIWELWKGQRRGGGLCHRPREIAVGLFPLQKAAASPSPATACPCPDGRRDPGTVTSLCIPRRVLGSTGGAGGTQEGQQEKKKQEGVGGKTNNPRATHEQDHHHHQKKGKLCGTWNCDFMEF